MTIDTVAFAGPSQAIATSRLGATVTNPLWRLELDERGYVSNLWANDWHSAEDRAAWD